MSWKDIENKHMKQWESFEAFKTATWKQMKMDHEAIRTSFGHDEQSIPEDTRKKMDKDIETWREQWADKAGTFKAVAAMQKEEKAQYLEQYQVYKDSRNKSKDDPEP